jgi:hypothetical protein
MAGMSLTLLPNARRRYKPVVSRNEAGMMTRIPVGVGLALGLTAMTAAAATKPPPAQKGPPTCAAIAFRPIPSGMTDGERQAGMYKSRHARLELHATVKQGEPVDYFVLAAGRRLGPAPPSLPEAAASCAAAKKMPAPGAPASSCTGQRFTVVVAHAGKDRLALLYGLDGSSWRFCTAGTF